MSLKKIKQTLNEGAQPSITPDDISRFIYNEYISKNQVSKLTNLFTDITSILMGDYSVDKKEMKQVEKAITEGFWMV